MERDFEYENNNIAFDEQYTEEDGGGIKCKNYELCQSVLPKLWFEYMGRYLCTECHMNFGTWGSGEHARTGTGILEISDNLDCPICLENKRSIKQPNCEHTLCIECFKRCYYGDDDLENEPKFPYPNIQDEYEEDLFNSEYSEKCIQKWQINYPLIKIYYEELDKWDDERQEKYDEEEYLRKCTFCGV